MPFEHTESWRENKVSTASEAVAESLEALVEASLRGLPDLLAGGTPGSVMQGSAKLLAEDGGKPLILVQVSVRILDRTGGTG